MNEIVVCADIHEGISFPIKIDPETGISARALDIHENFKRIAKFAIEHNTKLFVIAGDLFDRTNVAPIYREIVRRDILEPLRAKKIKVWIISGNHDEPHVPRRGTSISDFEDYDRSYITVYRVPTVERVFLNEKKVLCLILPYLHQAKILELAREKGERIQSKEQFFALGRKFIKKWLAEKAKEPADYKILFTHYYIQGAKLRDVTYPEVLPGEFSITEDILPENLDIVILGHVHLHQKLKRNNVLLIYTGGIERIDWGERSDPKGYVVINVDEKSWEFKQLPTREFIKVELELTYEDLDPTATILESIGEIKDKMVRLDITLPAGLKARINQDILHQRLKESFHYELRWLEKIERQVSKVSFTADPFELLRDFVELNYSKHPKKNMLLEEGWKLVMEALE
jgi:exonuclease SbcD